MPKRTAAVAALTVVFALTLAGCTGTPEDAGDERTAPVASESAAPLVAESPSAEPGDDADAKFLHDVRESLTNGRDTSIPDATDAQLLEAGYAACEQLAAGKPDTEVQVVENETPDALYGQFPESYIIAGVASVTIC